MIDGFKVSQRKVMYTMLERNKKMKVEQFANDTSAFTHYHHGSTNLEGVIVGLAQDFPGSNNVNFLTPVGQFGNILNSAASAGRYIFVDSNPNFRKWFRKEDDCILEHELEDGSKIEPVFYLPVVPTILFNGSAGIGTGYSTNILSYKPADVVENVKLVLAGKKLKKMVPWYQGYTGLVTKDESQTVYIGKFERVNSTTLKITALPIGHDLDSYKTVLGGLMEKGVIKDYDDNSTDAGWSILVYALRTFTANDDAYIIDKLKLVTKASENITVWNEQKKIVVFENPEDLITYFVKWRLTAYESRRQKQISILQEDFEFANEKIRFIKYYIKNAKWFSENTKVAIVTSMTENNFKQIDDLLSIRIYNLTQESIQKLESDAQSISAKIDILSKITAKDMYTAELKAVLS
jgi:DNA topoisomerase-2